MKPSTPSAPDPAETAQAQAASNRDTALTQYLLNTGTQNNPWGSVSYTQNGERSFVDSDGNTVRIPNFTQNTTLSPAQLAIFDQQQAAQGNLAGIANDRTKFLGDYLKQNFNMNGAPALVGQTGVNSNFSGTIGNGYNSQFQQGVGGNFATGVGPGYQTSYAGAQDFEGTRQQYTDALLQRMAPQMEQDQAALRTQLANKGIREGSAAWDAEMARMSSATTDARLAATLAGGQEQARMVGMAQQAAQFGNESILNRFGAQNQASLQGAAFGSSQQQAQNQAALGQAGFAQNAQQLGNNANLQNMQAQNAARAQYMQEQLAIRNQPLNEIGALMSGSQIQNPGQMSPGMPQVGVGGVDVAGINQQAYQNQLAAGGSPLGGLFGLGASVIGAGGAAGGFGNLFKW